jgi:hypothetical protein
MSVVNNIHLQNVVLLQGEDHLLHLDNMIYPPTNFKVFTTEQKAEG